MKPEISIIIPTKDEGKYLERTLKQYLPIKKEFKIEVIVSDGGSSDDTIKIAKKYTDKCVLAQKGKPQNIAIGRNAGAKAAKGKILFHTDADVIIPDIMNFFKKVIKLFKDEKVVAITTKLKIRPHEIMFRDKFFHFLINNSVKVSIYLGLFLGRGECQIVRNSAFKKIKGYDEKIVLGEDGNLFYRLAKIGEIVYIDDLFIYHSPRRFRKEGYIKVFSQYIVEGVFLYFIGKSKTKEWKPFR